MTFLSFLSIRAMSNFRNFSLWMPGNGTYCQIFRNCLNKSLTKRFRNCWFTLVKQVSVEKINPRIAQLRRYKKSVRQTTGKEEKVRFSIVCFPVLLSIFVLFLKVSIPITRLLIPVSVHLFNVYT